MLYSASFPVGSTLSETMPRVWGGRERETWPEMESHCLITPSADTLSTVSAVVQCTPHTASECAASIVHKSSDQVLGRATRHTFRAIVRV